jgi:hypothetical protein
VVTLARDLDFTGSRFFTGLTAEFVARLRYAPAGKVGTFSLLNGRHRRSPYLKFGRQTRCLQRFHCQHSWSFQKSIHPSHQNCNWQPQRADLRIVSAGRADCDAVPIVKRIGNNREPLAIHVDMHKCSEAQVPDLAATIGSNGYVISSVTCDVINNAHRVPPFSTAPMCAALFSSETRTLLSDGFLNPADQVLYLSSFLFRVAGNFQVGVVRSFPDGLFDLSFYFVKLAFSPVLRTWFHHQFLSPVSR